MFLFTNSLLLPFGLAGTGQADGCEQLDELERILGPGGISEGGDVRGGRGEGKGTASSVFDVAASELAAAASEERSVVASERI